MRLIDADEAVKIIKKYDDRGLTIDEVTRITDGIAKEIEVMPTVDAEPIRHGKWIKTFWCEAQDPITGDIEKKYKHDCPVCGYHTGHQGSYFNYCPNCGTKMEGE